MARKYEYKDEEDRAALAPVLNLTFPVLLHLFKQLLAAPPASSEVPELVKLVCKIFWSATYMGIPTILVERTQFVEWMTCFHTAISQPVPAVRTRGQPYVLIMPNIGCMTLLFPHPRQQHHSVSQRVELTSESD